jgi:hypothetical protein
MKIGVLVPELVPSQMSYFLTKNINDACSKNVSNDFVVFFENLSGKVIEPAFAMMNMTEIWTFEGYLITTSISTTLTAIKSMSPSEKYFYVWDLEWLRDHGKNFEYNIAAFTDKNVKLLARSESHAEAIKNYCNRDVVGIVEDFNIDQFIGVIENELCGTE